MNECPASDILARFVEDVLVAGERLAIEAHLDECDDCRPTVALMVRAATAERRASEPTLASDAGVGLAATEVAAPAPNRGTAFGRLAPATKLGRYVIGDVIGTGGMGVVYAARDPELHRDVAIKVLRPELSRVDPDATRRIAREAQAMARIAHPNVVAVYDVGTIDDTSDGQVFVAMERVTGTSLRAWLAAAERTPAQVLEMFTAAGRGLIAAHDAGMVHRDFKPDNVLVGDDGRARVTDFGLAFEEGDGVRGEEVSERETRPIVGTPAYMAPEQHAGAHLDPRTDQFGFAVALYEALYGARPFAGATREQLADAVLDGRITASPVGTRVPASLRAILLRALSVKPGDRFPTLAEMLRALGRDRGRRPRRLASGAMVVCAILAVAFAADTITRARTHAATRTSFAAARTQLDKLLALRTEAFAAQSDALFGIPVMQQVVASRDMADFGLGDASEDRARLERVHETLRSADWVGLTRTHASDVLAIADHKGRLLFGSATDRWGTDLTLVPALAAAYAAGTDTYLGVLDAADPDVIASGLLGDAHPALYIAFARVKRIGVQARAMFVQLFDARRVLEEVGVGNDMRLSVVTANGAGAGTVPAAVVVAATDEEIDELVRTDGTWLVQRAPLDEGGQRAAIAELVLARRTDVGLSGLFPHARPALGGLFAVFAGMAVGGLVVARRRDLTRTRARSS